VPLLEEVESRSSLIVGDKAIDQQLPADKRYLARFWGTFLLLAVVKLFVPLLHYTDLLAGRFF
jgi:hypothetical protein